MAKHAADDRETASSILAPATIVTLPRFRAQVRDLPTHDATPTIMGIPMVVCGGVPENEVHFVIDGKVVESAG